MVDKPEHPYLEIETGKLKDLFELISFSGHEEMSRLSSFVLELESEEQDVKPEDVLGQKVSFSVRHGPKADQKRHFSGYVCRFSAGTSETQNRRYEVEVVPWLWLLTRTSDCRIFAKKRVPQILKEVFKDFPQAKVEWKIKDSDYREWVYCVQYRETDFNFVSRLMEQEGIFYYFKHDESGEHTMVIGDAPGHYQKKVDVEYEYSFAGVSSKKDVVTSWTRQYQFIPGKYTQTDYNFEEHPPRGATHPDQPLAASIPVKDVPGNLKGEFAKYEIYDYPGEYPTRDDGDHYTTVNLEEERAAFDAASGASVCEFFSPGAKFKIKFPQIEKKDAIEGGEYVLTSVQHSAADVGPGGSQTYTNTFTCIPAKVAFRPDRATPKPAIQGAQTAVVVGPKGSEIHTDEFGRVQVQFFWDRYGDRMQKEDAPPDKPQPQEPIWVRVGQIIAGKQWGAMFIPRVGQEVIVTFLEGDPDRPLVTGVVYNKDQMPPYDPKEDKTKSYIKTNSSQGGDGYNEIQFEDKADQEMLYFHAQRDMDARVRANSKERIGGDRHLIIGGEEGGSKSGDQKEMVYRDKHLKIHRNQEEHVGGDMKLTVGGIDGPGNQDVVIKKDKKELIEGENHVHVKLNRAEKVDMDQSLTVGMNQQEKVGMKHALEAGQEIHLKAGMKVVIEAGLQLTIKGPGGFVDIGPMGVTIQGNMVNINSGGAAGVGSGSNPTAPKDAQQAAPDKPEEAHQDEPKSGQKSTPF